jgi:hypothetical protein
MPSATGVREAPIAELGLTGEGRRMVFRNRVGHGDNEGDSRSPFTGELQPAFGTQQMDIGDTRTHKTLRVNRTQAASADEASSPVNLFIPVAAPQWLAKRMLL